LTLSAFFFYFSRHPPPLPSFPTRRSSDLFLASLACASPRAWHLLIFLVLIRLEDFLQFFVLLLRNGLHFLTALVARHAGEKMQADRKSTRLNSSHVAISYAVFRLKNKSTT